MSCLILYHFLFLQPIAILTNVNLNCILCFAISDPFAGRFYRIIAITHQSIVVPFLTKMYGFCGYHIFVSLGLKRVTKIA